MGALIAGTVPAVVLALDILAVAALGLLAIAARPWQGPVAVALALAMALVLLWHAVRRLGGITGDVVGAAIEVATTAALVVLSIGQ